MTRKNPRNDAIRTSRSASSSNNLIHRNDTNSGAAASSPNPTLPVAHSTPRAPSDSEWRTPRPGAGRPYQAKRRRHTPIVSTKTSNHHGIRPTNGTVAQAMPAANHATVEKVGMPPDGALSANTRGSRRHQRLSRSSVMGYAPCERPRSARDTRPRRWPSSPDAGRILKLPDATPTIAIHH